MDTGESEADRQVLGYAGTSLLVILAIFGAVIVAGGIREIARQHTAAGVFSAQVLVAQRPHYEVAFTGPDGFVRMDAELDTYVRHPVGSRVAVRYWPVEHRAEQVTTGARAFIAIGALMLLAGTAGASFRIIRAVRRRRDVR
ncbi:hypothetical protein [Amycolatopsis sp. lyj-109]|uniref:hypothetical protein n=1 Tax=Amycolatopsis sp. lyj-109 TaxID=2789287 RepID=UPI00397C9995